MSDTFANNVATTDRVLAAQIRQVFNDQNTAHIDPVEIGAIASDTTNTAGASKLTNIITISQANYDALGVKDPGTLYVIV